MEVIVLVVVLALPAVACSGKSALRIRFHSDTRLSSEGNELNAENEDSRFLDSDDLRALFRNDTSSAETENNRVWERSNPKHHDSSENDDTQPFKRCDIIVPSKNSNNNASESSSGSNEIFVSLLQSLHTAERNGTQWVTRHDIKSLKHTASDCSKTETSKRKCIKTLERSSIRTSKPYSDVHTRTSIRSFTRFMENIESRILERYNFLEKELPPDVKSIDDVADRPRNLNSIEDFDDEDDDVPATNVLVSFVMIRHGLSTITRREVEKLMPFSQMIMITEDEKKLTESGVGDCYQAGQYLRNRHLRFISDTFNPDEIVARASQSKLMTRCMKYVLKGLYPHERRDVPFFTVPPKDDDFLFNYNCPRFTQLKNITIKNPELKPVLNVLNKFYRILSETTGARYSTPEDVYRLFELLEIMVDVYHYQPPKLLSLMYEDIAALANVHIYTNFYTTRQIQLATGVMMKEIIDAIDLVHENVTSLNMYLTVGEYMNMVAWMSAVRVLVPHIPLHGSIFSIEICYLPRYKDYAVKAVYKPDGEESSKSLEIRGCHDKGYCSTKKFKKLFKKYVMTIDEYKHECKKLGDVKTKHKFNKFRLIKTKTKKFRMFH